MNEMLHLTENKGEKIIHLLPVMCVLSYV